MQVTRPELPIRAGLGLRCLRGFFFGTGRVTMATWGHSICPFPRLGTGSHGDDSGDHMSSLALNP